MNKDERLGEMSNPKDQLPLLFQHILEPKADEIFYHYCSLE